MQFFNVFRSTFVRTVIFYRNDNRVLDWTNCDEWLDELFAHYGFDWDPALDGDGQFYGARNHFRTKMVPLVPDLALSQEIKDENTAMNITPTPIEQYYDLLGNICHLAQRPELLPLGNNPQKVHNQTNSRRCSF
jgi:hypothetical protein